MHHYNFDLVVARIARRCRISLAAARLVVELAGIGQAVRQ